MRKQTHYQTLDLPENATTAQIRAAYRKLVLKLHPDRSGDPSTTEQFMSVNAAYQVLSDPTRRRDYDAGLRFEREYDFKRTYTQQTRPAEQPRTAPSASVSKLLMDAAKEFSFGRMDRAQALAKQIIKIDSTQAMAYAMLGDIARLREDLNGALNHYAYAVQFEPRNPTYLRRYEDLNRMITGDSPRAKAKQANSAAAAILTTIALSGLMLGYVAIAREAPMFESAKLISSWSVGLFVMMFVNGVLVGSTLSISQAVDRWETVMRSSSGRIGPAAALGLIAIVSFWASALIYIFLGLLQNSFTYSISRLITLVATLTVAYALMSNLSPAIIPTQTLLWGGNVIYLGALCGWVVADALR